MEKSTALENVLSIIKNTFDIQTENLTLETKLSSFLDSMDIIELSMEMEKELSRGITDHVIESWQTLGEVVDTYLLLLN